MFSTEHIVSDKFRELPADVVVACREPLGLCIAVVDGYAKVMPEDVCDIAFPASDASRDAY